eukprot:scaffold123404_cov23-Tisochrysis_lutea.AAC.2
MEEPQILPWGKEQTGLGLSKSGASHHRLHAHLEDPKLGQPERHARPSGKCDAAGATPGLEPAQRVLHVLLDLIRRFQPEESEVAQKVVLQREELQVKLRQSEGRAAAEPGGHLTDGRWRDERLVPWRALVGVERHLTDGLVLGLGAHIAVHKQ